jgi:hypothetical protein
MNFPMQKATVRLIALEATRIRKAFKIAIDGDAIAQAWAETHPAGGSVSPQTARDWVQALAVTNKKPMQVALARLYADSYTFGAKVAKTRLKGLKKDASVAVEIDWTNWKPGSESAAALVKPRGGLRALLDSRKITLADEVIHTKLDRIGTALARGLEEGLTPKQTAKMIDFIIDDPQQALIISQTETSRAMSVASRNAYEEAQVDMVEWLVAEGCDLCQENADASPIGIDEEFPSGDTEPPAHPNCMCALAPYFDPNARNDSNDFEDEEIY